LSGLPKSSSDIFSERRKKMALWTNERTAVMSVQYGQYTWDYFLDSMRRCGYTGVDFWAGAPHFCPEMFRSRDDARKRAREIRSQLDDTGMRVACYTLEQINYPINIASADPVHRAISVEYFLEGMEYAQILGTKRVFVTSGAGQRDLPREQSMTFCIESLQALCREAGNRGMQMVIEQLQPFETNLGLSLGDMQEIKERVASPQLKVCVDVVAMAVAGETLDAYCTAFGKDLVLIHMADGSPGGHLVPGDGHLDVTGYFKTLQQHDFAGTVTLEINSTRYLDDPHAALARTMDYLEKEIFAGD
jgi:fructoselysine 3-epimerase